nr:hypothetical protein PFGHJN_00048 [Escherichia phage UP30]
MDIYVFLRKSGYKCYAIDSTQKLTQVIDSVDAGCNLSNIDTQLHTNYMYSID